MDERLKAIIQDYGLDKSDVWQLPQNNKTWLIKHAALEVVAVKAGVKFLPPTVLEADSANGLCAIVVTGTFGDRTEWSIGEASPKNAKNAYPWAIAEKRAKDRVILKLIGIHGLVYSEDEMPTVDVPKQDEQPAPQPPSKPKAQSREMYAEMQAEIDKCQTLLELGTLWRSTAFQTEYAKLPNDWKQDITDRKDERKAKLAEAAEEGAPRGYVPPNFDGPAK